MGLSQSSAMALAQDALSSAMQKNGNFGDYQYIENMADFVAKNKPSKKGTKEIQVNKLVVFDGTVLSLPEKQKTDYLSLTMEVAKLNPKPVVEHSIFVEVSTEPQVVIPVYIVKSVAAELERFYKSYGATGFKNQKIRFAGVHIYNYNKGPAIVVESIASTK